MKEAIAVLAMFTLWAGGAAAWITAIIHHANEDLIGWLIIVLFIPPIGVIQGLFLWFGN